MLESMCRALSPGPVGWGLWLLPFLFGLLMHVARVEGLEHDKNNSPVPPMVQYQWTALGDSY